VAKAYEELRLQIAACCKDAEETSEVSMKALRLAERIRRAQGQQRRDMMARLKELRLRVEDLERQRR
jgi:hypothetical protein